MKIKLVVLFCFIVIYGCGVPSRESGSSRNSNSSDSTSTAKFAIVYEKTDADYLVIADASGNDKSTVWSGKSNYPSGPLVSNSKLYFFVSPNLLYSSDYSGNKTQLSSSCPSSIYKGAFLDANCGNNIVLNTSGVSYVYDELSNSFTNLDVEFVTGLINSGTKFIGCDADKIVEVGLNGSGKIILLSEGSTNNVNPIISPDGTKIAYVKHNSNSYIAINNTSCSSEQIIFNGNANGLGAIWSIVWLSNTQLAFEGENASIYTDIYTINSDGTSLNNLTNTPATNETFTWKTVSLANNIIYYHTVNSIMCVNFDGTGKTTCFTSLDNIGSFILIQ